MKRVEINYEEIGRIVWELPPSLAEHLEAVAALFPPENREGFFRETEEMMGNLLARFCHLVKAAVLVPTQTLQLVDVLSEGINKAAETSKGILRATMAADENATIH